MYEIMWKLGVRYVEHLCGRAKIALSLVFSEDNYFFALLRGWLAYLQIRLCVR